MPYRGSKLTALLKPSLGGNALTLMIACLAPTDASADENASTLQYAARASRIVNRPVVNVDGKSRLIARLRAELAALRAQLARAQRALRRRAVSPAAEHGRRGRRADRRPAPRPRRRAGRRGRGRR